VAKAKKKLPADEGAGILDQWRQARRGSTDAARLLLLMFCAAVDSKEEVPRALLGYLRSAFLRCLKDGVPIAKALYLAKPKHRPRGTHSSTHDPFKLAVLFYLYVVRDGMTRMRAAEKVAENRNIEVRSVHRAIRFYKALEHSAMRLSEDELEALLT